MIIQPNSSLHKVLLKTCVPTALGKQEWDAYKISFSMHKQLAGIAAI